MAVQDSTSAVAVSENGVITKINQSAIAQELEKLSSNNGNYDSPFYEKFLGSVLDQKKDYPLPIPIASLLQNGKTIPLLTLKSLSLWQGKQKSKKTTALALLIAALIKNQQLIIDGIGFTGSLDGIIIFFDTEQGESYAARTMKLILKMAGVEYSDRLIYCDLREFSPDERIKIIKAGIEGTRNAQLVVIDGIVDLMNDFMDAKEGHLTVIDLQKLTSEYNIHIAAVLHQNKKDANARAHIGSIASQKCEMEFATEVDPDDRNQSLVICVNSRDLPFETFAIRWDRGSLPCINQEWSSSNSIDAKACKNYDRSKEIAEAVFKPLAALSHTEAIKGIMNVSLKSESTAKRLLKDLTSWDIINQGPDKKYRINLNQGSRVHEGSNMGS